MKIHYSLAVVATITICYLTSDIVRAEDVLWNLTFKDLKAGEPLATVPYTAPSSGPQNVSVDGSNTLLGAASVGTLSPALQMTKGSTSHYMPSLTMKGTTPFTTGVITVNVDVMFDKITANPAKPIETLMAFAFINGDNGTTFIPVIATAAQGKLVLGGAGLAKPKNPTTFAPELKAHFKFVLDLNAHTFQAFLNDSPIGDAEHDDKFASFLGLTIRDGTALGGNNGGTYTAGLANLVITHS